MNKRLLKEYNHRLKHDPDNKFEIELVNNNLFKWKATFKGPQGTPFSNGKYIIHINMENGYPLKPPQMQFINAPYCLNVVGYNDNGSDNNLKFGSVSYHLLKDRWSPALQIVIVLSNLYDFCFYECGFDQRYNINHPQNPIYLNKYEEYTKLPRQFLFNASKYNEIYGNGDKRTYYILPQINEMKYFQNISIIDNILRDQYKCSDDLIETFLLFYGKKINYCGLSNTKFVIPKFNGIEDNNDDDIMSVNNIKNHSWRTYDEIKTDIDNAKQNGKTFNMIIRAFHGCSNTLYFDACDTLTISDLKIFYHHMKGWRPEQLILIWKGKHLDNTRQLKDLNFYQGCTIYVTMGLYGG